MMKSYGRIRLWKRIVSMLIVIVVVLGAIGYFRPENAKADESTKPSRDQEIALAYYPEDYIGYRFSVLPGTSSWPYGDFTVMIDACRIPVHELKAMSTEALLQTVLVHPLILNIYAYENFDEGYEIVKRYCDCLDELCLRNDRVECLYNYLTDHAEEFLSVSSDIGDEYIEFLMEKPRSVFFLLATNKDFFSDQIKDSNTAIEKINNILYGSRRTFGEEENRDVHPVSFHSFLGVDWSSKTYLWDATTPKGGSMHAYKYNVMEEWLYSDGMYRTRYLSSMSSGAKTAVTNQMYGLFGIYPESGNGPTSTYNCHSYAWCSNVYKYSNWINGEDIDFTGYVETTVSGVNIGGNVIYFWSSGGSVGPYTTRNHSAVVVGKTYSSGYVLTLKSKWGCAGVYTHSVSNCPYYYYDPSTYTPCDRKYYN